MDPLVHAVEFSVKVVLHGKYMLPEVYEQRMAKVLINNTVTAQHKRLTLPHGKIS